MRKVWKRSLIVASAASLVTSGGSYAAIYLDNNGTIAGFGSLSSALWDATNTNWTTDAGGATTTVVWNDNGSLVTTFDNSGGSGAATVNVGANFSPVGLALQGSQSVTLVSNDTNTTRTLTVGSSGIDVVASRTLGINTRVQLTGTSMTKTGSGTLDFLNVATSRMTAPSLTVSAGTVIFRNAGNLQDGTGSFHRPTITNNGSVQLFNNITANVGAISGSGTFSVNNATAAYTLDVSQGSDMTFSGTLSPNANTTSANGIFSLVKRGASTLRLTGALTHDGGTSIEGGTLLINNSWVQNNNGGTNAPSDVANLSVNNGTLGGTGSIQLANARNVVVGASGRINPGDPSMTGGIGTLTIVASSTTGGFIASSGSNLDFDLGSAGVSDLLRFNSVDLTDVSFTGVTVNPITPPLAANSSYTLMAFYSDAGTTLLNSNIPLGGLTLAPSFVSAYPGSYLDNSTAGLVKLVVVVPEPGAAVAMMGVGVLGLVRRRRA